ncbi:hypothetical protein D5045_22365 [Verminephrobacter eiseniae]|nr:hypothetical protein [Verminephrobacter eiseniae]
MTAAASAPDSISTSFVNAKAERRQHQCTASGADEVTKRRSARTIQEWNECGAYTAPTPAPGRPRARAAPARSGSGRAA